MTGRRLQITLQPAVLRWARERAGFAPEELAGKLGMKPERVLEWERTGKISIAQADKLAQRTHTPLGFLYLTEPPEDRLPIPDFRTRSGSAPRRPSPDLLETVETMQRRGWWMRGELIESGVEPLAFVGSCRKDDDPAQAARVLREALRLAPDWAAHEFDSSGAMRRLRDAAEEAGVLVVFNGVVENNTSRALDPNEFQGFALADDYAPLVFVNGADFKAARMFTLAHELAHLLVGETGVSAMETVQPADHAVERFCNRTAAEFLAPAEDLQAFWPEAERADDPYLAVARRFKVSSLVAARRALDLDLIERNDFFDFYREYAASERLRAQQDESSGNFWNTQKWRVGPRFGGAVARAVREGRLLYRDAYSLTGLRGKTFDIMPEKMEVVL